MTRAHANPIRRAARSLRCAASVFFIVLAALGAAHAQGLGSNCTATFLNRSVQISDDGTFNLPNVPYNPGLFRVHIVCTNDDGTTSGGQSDPTAIVPNGAFAIPLISIGPIPPSLLSINVRADSALLSTAGATTQINVIATLANGTNENYSADAATTYSVSNPAIATVSPTGLLTAVGAGVVTVTARNDGLVGTATVNINALIDTDGDGIPDTWEIAHGLNPYDPTDAAQDPDNDGLTNLQEYQAGTDPHVADTDGDGLSDGQEVKLGTNPLIADTDGDGLTDGQEVALGTNPLLADTDGDGIPDGLEVEFGTNPLVADPTTTVTARVLDGNNKPVPGASATVLQYFTGTTDATGSFTILHVPTDAPSAGGTLTASVLAVLSGGVVANGTSSPVAPVAGGLTDLGVIQLGASTGVVTGAVTTATGKAVAGAQVSVTGTNIALTTTTNASGVYTVTSLSSGAIVVSVLDPATGLRGQATGTMLPQPTGPLTLNVRLGGYGTVAGSVLTATGAPAASGITVSLSGSTLLTTTTGALGAYSFPFVPLGAFVVQASDAAGDTGTNAGFVATTNETITANIQFLGNGTVSGRVADAANNPAANATVTLLNSGTTPQKLTTQTDSSGHYAFSGVFVGSFAVTAGFTGTTTLGGTTMATLNQQGQTLTVNITLTAAGSAHGLVVRADGQTPAAGVTVRAGQNAISTTTDSTGAYTLAFIPAGSVTLFAADPATGDQGSITATITAAATAQVPNLVLNGVGAVHVTVTDASGAVVPSAQLTLTSDSAFTQQLTGLIAGDGTYTFQNVLAGPITVMATNPANQLAGTAQATAITNATVNVAVQLQPAGTIAGTVSVAGTPAAGVTVQLDGATTTVSASDGTYQFATVPAGAHLVVALDGQNTATSPTVTATIASQGQTVTANLTLITRGTVTGTVSNADGTPASGAAVSVHSLTPGFVRALSGQADINGVYTIANVPAGPIALSAYTATASGQSAGTLLSNGTPTTVNITLTANQTRSAQSLYDANAMPYDLDATGEISGGLNSVFEGTGLLESQRHSDTLLLTLESTGVQLPFTGRTFATTLQSGQEIAIEQDGLLGLNVTRRIYVPSNGYLARYVEAFTNPTASDITITVSLRDGFRYTHETRNGYDYQGIPQINASSSGDASFNVTTTPSTTDRWVVEGVDQDTDPFLDTATVPSVGYLFDDGNGQVALTSGDFFADTRHGQLDATWQHIRVPANATVELMHFTAQQPLRAGAQAAVQRLIQLPPEALSGLSPADASAILNFHVPTNLSSTLTALPTLTGQVTGVVVAGDNTTPIQNAIVSYKSTDPLYSRTYTARTDSIGSYTFTGTATPGTPSSASTVAVPLEGFNVSAVHPVTAVTSPSFLSSIDPTVTAAVQSIVFSNTGQQQGTVRFNGSNIVTSGTVTIASLALSASIVLPIQPDGTYAINGLPVGSYTATANVAGTFLSGVTTTTIANGVTATADILINSGGILTGHVLGSTAAHTPLPNITVYLRLATQTLASVTDSTGRFTFTDVPAGTYTLQAYDPLSNTAASAVATVASSGTTSQDITLSSTGSATVQVTAPTGVSVASLNVTLAPSSGGTPLTATTNSAGLATFTGVPVGPFTVSTAASGGYSGTATGTLGLAGQTASVAIVLGPHGVVNGTIFNADGTTPAPGLQVQLYGTAPGALYSSLLGTTRTDANGAYLFNSVPVGGFTISAQNTTTGDAGSGLGTLAVASQQVTLNFNLTGLGTVTLTVLNGNQTPDSGVQVTASSAFSSTYNATTSAQGIAILRNVLAGTVTLTASDPITRLTGSTTVALAANGTAAATITLQSTENIVGHIYQPLRTAVAAGAQLQIYLFGTRSPYATTTSKADGSYTFSGVPLGAYVINVSDANGVFRAYANLTLSAAGTTVTQDIAYIGLGTVRGTVSNPDSTAASGIYVALTSQSAIGGNQTVQADQNGIYTIANVAVGTFQVSAQDLSRGVGASASGTITADGDIETVNLQLVSNVISLTKTLTDYNGFPYDIQADGSIANGVTPINLVTRAGGFPTYNNAFHLALYQSGAKTDFTGASTAITTLNGRQLAIAQTAPIAGLNVTRKVFVPADGYFARYLELLSNPTASPITVDVQVSGGVQYPYPNAITQTTSSGAPTLSPADTTLVTTSAPSNSPFPYNQPALGEAFEGPAAPTPISAATYVTPTSANGLYYPQLTYRWNTITIPAGAQVAFLHFATQQTAQGQAVASATRLDQLPPEGLYGLTSAELSAITNFAVPTGGTSQRQPLTVPALGSVTGHLTNADGTINIPGGEVVVHGTDLYLGATKAQLTDANGQFNFTGFPVANYTLQGLDPVSVVLSPYQSGSFAQGSINSTQNVAFTNTGTLAGTIVAPLGTTYTSATAYLANNGSNGGTYAVNVVNGAFSLNAVLPGTYNLITQATPPLAPSQGTGFYIAQSVTIAQGTETAVTVNLPQTGTVSGTFLNAQGQPEVNAYVALQGTAIGRSQYTDANGAYTFPQVPYATYTLTGYESSTSLTAAATVTVASASITQNLQIATGGTINLTATYASGAPASNSLVTITRSGAPFGRITAGVTDANGNLQITTQPVGAFTVTVFYPGQPNSSSSISVAVNGSVTSNGQTAPVTAVFPATSSITGTVTTYSGTPVAQAQVALNYTNSATAPYRPTTTSSSTGAYTFSPVVAGLAAQLQANPPNIYSNYSVTTITTPASGTTLTQNLRLPVNATVVVTALDANNNPLVGNYILLQSTAQPGTTPSGFYSYQQTSSSGTTLFTQVPDAPYSVTLYDSTAATFLGSTTFTVHPIDDGNTVNITVQTGYTGTVSGSLLAADGATPVPPSRNGAQVSIFDADTKQSIASYTSTDGTFTFPNIVLGRDGYTLSASYYSPAYSFSSVSVANIPGTITADGQTQTANLTLPVPVLTGTVFAADGTTPVPNPSVTVTAANYGTPIAFYATSDANGVYTVALPVNDQVSLLANANGLTTQLQRNIAGSDTIDTQDITLVPSGTVTGHVVDLTGNPIFYDQIAVTSDGSTYTISTNTDQNGLYTFTGVATGNITVTVNNYCTATATGVLTNNGDTLTLNLTVDTTQCGIPNANLPGAPSLPAVSSPVRVGLLPSKSAPIPAIHPTPTPQALAFLPVLPEGNLRFSLAAPTFQEAQR